MSNNKDILALTLTQCGKHPPIQRLGSGARLRSSQLGVAFRRQVPLLGFIADFYAPSARLVVEVDGGYHARRVSADARRDRGILAKSGA